MAYAPKFAASQLHNGASVQPDAPAGSVVPPTGSRTLHDGACRPAPHRGRRDHVCRIPDTAYLKKRLSQPSDF